MTLLGESEYLRRQDMNSKSGEELKKGHHVRKVLILTHNRVQSKKKYQNDNALILGRVSINTRSRPSSSYTLILGRVLGLDSAHPYIDIASLGIDWKIRRKARTPLPQ